MFENDVATVGESEAKFSLDAWRKRQSRAKQFPFFLQENKLVGMPRTKMTALLGLPDSPSRDPNLFLYSLWGGCTDHMAVIIECDLDRVIRYRYSKMAPDQWFDATKKDSGDVLSKQMQLWYG